MNAINTLRNCCAHHGRVWYRVMLVMLKNLTWLTQRLWDLQMDGNKSLCGEKVATKTQP